MEGQKTVLREMKICRFCFHGEEKDLSSIYQKEPKTVPLPVQIMSCVSIAVFPNDGFPQLICNACKQQTNQSYVFKSNCKKADDALKNFLQSEELAPQDLVKSQPKNKRKFLSKPITPVKDIKVVTSTLALPDSPDVKRTKLDDGTEIITLCITKPESTASQDDSSQDSGENSNKSFDNESADEECYNQEIQVQTENYICQYCDKTFPTQSRLDTHLADHHHVEVSEQVPTDIFPCPNCERTFPLQQLLDLHVTNHHRERQFPCSQCDSKFFTKYDMMKHQITHVEQKSFTCSICSKSFGRETILRRHEQTHVEAPKYMCSCCERTFVAKEDLNIHMKWHEKKRPFTCETCDKSFVFKQGLERHMNNVHAEDRPYKCNYCEASFNSPIRLTRHITTHAGLRPYPCKLCGRTFLLSHHLTRHMRNHYAAEQGKQPQEAVGQHKCDLCSMAFKRKDSLINHTAIHSMVNLRCVICNTSFENAKAVKEHITTHLQGLRYPCVRCDYSFETQSQLEEHELKHAEMEYEEQIEQEVISEVNQTRRNTIEDSDCDEHEFIEEHETSHFHIPDLNNPDIIAAVPPNLPFSDSIDEMQEEVLDLGEVSGEKSARDGLKEFFKTEVTEPHEDNEHPHVTGEDDEGEHSAAGEEKGIRPIFRVEGTKMYGRKGPIRRRIPKIQTEPPNVQTVPLETINEPLNMGSITQETLSNLPSKKPVNIKVGDKVVKVQKFIISKEEMKQMAKLGILELKNGQVTMKNPGQPILNAVIKPVQQSDIETLLNSQKNATKPPRKQYDRKADNSVGNIIEDFS